MSETTIAKTGVDAPPREYTEVGIAQIRSSLVNACLVAGSLLGAPIQLIATVLPFVTGDELSYRREFFGYLMAVTVTVARHRLPYALRAGFVISIVLLTAINQLIEKGLAGASVTLMLASVVLTALLFGKWGAMLLTAVTATVLIAFGWALHTGLYTVPIDMGAYTESFGMHLSQASGIVFFGIMLALLFGSIQDALMGSIEALTARTAEVELANERLRTEVEERIRTEAALRESREQFKTLLDAAPIAVSVTRNGKFIFCNNESLRIHGVQTQEDLSQKGPLDFTAPEFREQVVLRQGNLNKGLSNDSIEIRYLRATGEHGWARTSSVPIRLNGEPAALVVAQDITGRKEAEAERGRLLRLIEQSGESLVITDASGNIEYVNTAFESTSGYSREEALGKNMNLLKSGLHDDAYYRAFWQTILSESTWQGRFQNRRKNGEIYVSESTVSPARDAAGRLSNFVEVSRDITSEIQREEHARQAQKMEAIGQLTGGIAHDFNNLLQVINLATEMAQRDIAAGHPAQDWLAKTSEAGTRAATLVAQLLAFSRRQSLSPVTLDLNVAIDSMLNLLRPLLGEHIELCWSAAAQPQNVFADRGLLEQVIMNLCVNARDAMQQGGKLTIETQSTQVPGDSTPESAWAVPGEYVLMRVSDTGAGMDAETLEHVFEPFFTTKPDGRGTGLGLATVYGIVKQHQGFITASSEPGHGSVFSVYLPRVTGGAKRSAHPAAQSTPGGTERILLAEDDPMVLDLAQHLLTRAGYDVVAAKNGLEAVEIFERDPDRFDLALLDVVMPGLGGRETCERIRAIRPELPVLFASGYSENVIHTNFVLDASFTLISKPYTNQALLHGIRSVLDRGPVRD